MNASEMRMLINAAWVELSRCCTGEPCYDLLQDAETVSSEVERKHRAKGKRFNASYRLSVLTTARLFVLRHAFEGSAKPLSWVDVATTRRDCVLAYALHEALLKKRLLVKAFPKTEVMGIDYARDIAV